MKTQEELSKMIIEYYLPSDSNVSAVIAITLVTMAFPLDHSLATLRARFCFI